MCLQFFCSFLKIILATTAVTVYVIKKKKQNDLLVHHPERQPKNVRQKARGSAEDHFPVYGVQMQDSHHSFDRISKRDRFYIVNP